jgi:hypothetical protein
MIDVTQGPCSWDLKEPNLDAKVQDVLDQLFQQHAMILRAWPKRVTDWTRLSEDDCSRHESRVQCR